MRASWTTVAVGWVLGVCSCAGGLKSAQDVDDGGRAGGSSSGWVGTSSGGTLDGGGSSSSSGGPLLAWHGMETPTAVTLHAVSAAAGQAFAVGDHGVILRFQDGYWALQPAPTVETLWGVWANPVTTGAYAVGSHGTLLEYDGATWTATTALPEQASFNGIWGTSTAIPRLYAVGGRAGGPGLAWSYDGTRWLENTLPVGTPALFSVTGRGTGTVWAAGENGALVKWSTGTWASMETPAHSTLVTVTAVEECCLVVAGMGGLALYHDGHAWTVDRASSSSAWVAAAVGHQGEVLLAGESGAVWQRNLAGAWEASSVPTPGTVWGLARLANDTVVAVGDHGGAWLYR